MLFYSHVTNGDIAHLPTTIETFLGLCSHLSRDKNNLIVFFEPLSSPLTHAEYRAVFWNTLLYLQHNDPKPPTGTANVDYSDPLWEFPFSANRLFVLGVSPSYKQRQSRNLGPGLIMVFQPRQIFQDHITGNQIGAEARTYIRQRLERWDGVPPHPDLNVYGQSRNREWAQYFIADEQVSEAGCCPLRRLGRRTKL